MTCQWRLFVCFVLSSVAVHWSFQQTSSKTWLSTWQPNGSSSRDYSDQSWFLGRLASSLPNFNLSICLAFSYSTRAFAAKSNDPLSAVWHRNRLSSSGSRITHRSQKLQISRHWLHFEPTMRTIQDLLSCFLTKDLLFLLSSLSLLLIFDYCCILLPQLAWANDSHNAVLFVIDLKLRL